MSPFLQFRLWLRRGPTPEKVGVGIAGVVLIAVLAWVAVPTGSAGGGAVATTGVPAAGATPGSSASGPASGTGSAAGNAGGGSSLNSAGAAAAPASVVGAGAAPAGAAALPGTSGGTRPSGSAATSSSTACSNLTSSDQGVTPTQIKLGVALFDLEGGASNSFIGVPPPQDQQADFQAVIDSINKAGGIQCRKIVPVWYQGNYLDSSQQHATCLQVVQDRVFALIDAVALDATQQGRDCVAENKIPLFDAGAILGSETRGSLYPYVFSDGDQWDWNIRNSVFGAQQLGWFKGLTKLGVLEDDCYPEVNSETTADLAAAGIPPSHVVTYDFGGCSTIPPPQQVEQAVLTFQSAGVSHVTDLSQVPKSGYFSKVAQTQNYHPKYNVSGGAPSVFDSSSGSSAGPNAQNFNGAISITELSYGAQNSKNAPYSPATTACNNIMASAGLASVQKQGAFFAGETCNLMWMFQMAAQRTAPLVRTGLVQGLDQSGLWLQSFPGGQANFNRPGVVSAGEYWRLDVYDGSCPCFRVPDPTWRPNL
jgi:hypothetical protein